MGVPDDLRALQSDIEGEVIGQSDERFDERRESFYHEFDQRRPLAVVSVASPADVSKVIEYASHTGIDLAVRGGGHSILGHSASRGGLVVDLSRLDDVDIDSSTRTAWAGGGTLAGDYTAKAARHGLVTGFGDTPTVGIGGITLGGGVGFLHRKLGLTIDSMLGAEIVTADGGIREIDDANEPDLFWAIRGGGGNFGVVTRLRFRLHPIDTVHGGILILPATSRLLTELVAIAREASDDLSVIAGVFVAPSLPFLPEEIHGRLVVMAMMVHAGPEEIAEAEVGHFRALASPLVDGIQVMPYTRMYEGEEGPPQPTAVSLRSTFSDAFSIDEADATIEALRSSTADMSAVQIRVLGGEVARVPADATAFAHRDRAMIVNVVAAYQDPARRAEHEAWVSDLRARIQVGPRGAYSNFHGDDSEEGVREIYPGATWDRLVDIKTRYDQSNLFSSNHNIPPKS